MAKNALYEVLAASPLFKNASPDDVGRVASSSYLREFGRGEMLFSEEDDAAAFFVVAEGRVKVFKQSPDGRELIIKIMRAGDMVGEAAALTGGRYPASAQALEDTTAAEVPRREFIALVKEAPELALGIIAALSARLYQISAVLEKLTLKEVPARLASYLLERATGGGRGPERVDLDVSKTALAAELGTVPETLSRALRRLADAGVIEVEGRRVVILDPASLRLLAGNPD
ncbi:MAG: Crp/Fnr family transcriptional regulator [Candidatus Zixiibacteriota bacterium]|jgi:CRP/FNR family transcriptional regulator